MGKQTDEIIKHLQGLIKTKTDKLAFELLPIKAPTTFDIKKVNLSNITLSKPPSYKLGEEVRTGQALFLLEFLHSSFNLDLNSK